MSCVKVTIVKACITIVCWAVASHFGYAQTNNSDSIYNSAQTVLQSQTQIIEKLFYIDDSINLQFVSTPFCSYDLLSITENLIKLEYDLSLESEPQLFYKKYEEVIDSLQKIENSLEAPSCNQDIVFNQHWNTGIHHDINVLSFFDTFTYDNSEWIYFELYAVSPRIHSLYQKVIASDTNEWEKKPNNFLKIIRSSSTKVVFLWTKSRGSNRSYYGRKSP